MMTDAQPSYGDCTIRRNGASRLRHNIPTPLCGGMEELMSGRHKPNTAEMAEAASQDVRVKETAETEQAAERAEKPHKPCVYCGPSVRGVARQYTVYAGEIPAALADFIKAHPAAKGLLVSVEHFARVRSNLGKNGTAEAILYQKIKSEL